MRAALLQSAAMPVPVRACSGAAAVVAVHHCCRRPLLPLLTHRLARLPPPAAAVCARRLVASLQEVSAALLDAPGSAAPQPAAARAALRCLALANAAVKLRETVRAGGCS